LTSLNLRENQLDILRWIPYREFATFTSWVHEVNLTNLSLQGGSMTGVQEQVTPETKRTQSVSISHNGQNHVFEYRLEEHVEKVRVAALDYYDVRGQARHEEFLFGPDNQTELTDTATMTSQTQPGSQLYLHRRAQRGG
jgi:hypothetical protein